jgi:hypothetical protein
MLEYRLGSMEVFYSVPDWLGMPREGESFRDTTKGFCRFPGCLNETKPLIKFSILWKIDDKLFMRLLVRRPVGTMTI